MARVSPAGVMRGFPGLEGAGKQKLGQTRLRGADGTAVQGGWGTERGAGCEAGRLAGVRLPCWRKPPWS